jgi:hypothetical protein
LDVGDLSRRELNLALTSCALGRSVEQKMPNSHELCFVGQSRAFVGEPITDLRELTESVARREVSVVISECVGPEDTAANGDRG